MTCLEEIWVPFSCRNLRDGSRGIYIYTSFPWCVDAGRGRSGGGLGESLADSGLCVRPLPRPQIRDLESRQQHSHSATSPSVSQLVQENAARWTLLASKRKHSWPGHTRRQRPLPAGSVGERLSTRLWVGGRVPGTRGSLEAPRRATPLWLCTAYGAGGFQILADRAELTELSPVHTPSLTSFILSLNTYFVPVWHWGCE